MLARNDSTIEDAISTIYDISQDSMLREEIRAREERLALEKRLREESERDKAALEAQSKLIHELKAEKDFISAENDRLRNLLISNGIHPDC